MKFQLITITYEILLIIKNINNKLSEIFLKFAANQHPLRKLQIKAPLVWDEEKNSLSSAEQYCGSLF